MNQHNFDAASLRMTLGLEPEERLLLICARLGLSAADRDELTDLLEQPLPWDRIVDSAQWHKLEGLLFYHLRGPEYSSRVPKPVLEVLQGLYRRNVARQLYYRAELGRVLQALHTQGIPVIVLKGAALVETVYPEPGLRPMVDLDLLVPEQEADKAFETVQGMGYAPTVDVDVQQDMVARDRQLAALVGLEKPVVVEIHVHIVERDSPLRFDIASFWQRARQITIAGVPALTLAPEDLLAHLSINFLKDRQFYSYGALGQLCDIAEVTRGNNGGTDWSLLSREATSSGISGPVFCGLYIAWWLLGAPLPYAVLESLQPPAFRHEDVSRLVRQRILGRDWVAKALVDPSRRYHWWAAPVALWGRIFLGKRQLAERYNAPGQSASAYQLYLRRWQEALSAALKCAMKPGETRRDLSTDRWLHSIYNSGKDKKSVQIAGASAQLGSEHR